MNEFKKQELDLEVLKKITGGALEDQENGEYEKLVQELMEKYKNLTPEEIEIIKQYLEKMYKKGN